MMNDRSQHIQRDRRSLRLPEYDYSQPGAYFITLVTHQRDCLFAEFDSSLKDLILMDAGKIVEEIWHSLPLRFPRIQLDEAIIMPNHFHGILWILDENSADLPVEAIHELPLQGGRQPYLHPLTSQESEERRLTRRRMLLPKIIGYYKMNSAKRINLISGTTGTSIWQRNYYEHVIRNETELYHTRKYILENPARWAEDKENPSFQIIPKRRGNS